MIWYMYSRTNVKKRFATMDPRKQILFSMIESDPKPSLSFFFAPRSRFYQFQIQTHSQMLNVWYIYLHLPPKNYPNVGIYRP